MTIVLRRKWEMNLDLFGCGSKSLKLTPKWIGRLNISQLGNPFHALILNHSHLLSTNPILHHIQNGRLGHQQRHSSEILGVNCKSGIFHPWVLDVHVLKVQVPPGYFRNRNAENPPQTFKSTFQEDRVFSQLAPPIQPLEHEKWWFPRWKHPNGQLVSRQTRITPQKDRGFIGGSLYVPHAFVSPKQGDFSRWIPMGLVGVKHLQLQRKDLSIRPHGF